MSDAISGFVLARLEKKSKLPVDQPLDTFDYIQSGHVDSIAIIRFVVDLEREFDIEIVEADLISPEFRTVGGLIALIGRKCAAKAR